MRSRLSEKEAWFRKIAGIQHHKLEWRSSLDFPTEFVVHEARSADLLVIGRDLKRGDAYNTLDLAKVVLNAGRPVLVVPEGIGTLRGRHVVIGWKDTREARRAVSDALPLLHEADTIAIAEVYDSDATDLVQQRMADVASFLGRHRIKVGPQMAIRRDGSDAEQLIRATQDAGGDLLVTGAYGHSRLGEWFLGGVTRELLASSPICCLLSH